ncbi:MAG: FxsA family protein [Magnetococcales bacterium]|nr:FxsA family protein [Magnetococcales bacterium]
MLRTLLSLFIIIPIIEIYLLIQVGEQIGLLPTLLTIVFTAVVGATLVRSEGIKTLNSLQERLNNHETPGKELADGAMLLLAGVLLVTPGFFTDGLGFLLAFPLTRAMLRKKIISLFAAHLQNSNQKFYSHHSNSDPNSTSTIEGEFSSHQEQQPPEKHQTPVKPLE